MYKKIISIIIVIIIFCCCSCDMVMINSKLREYDLIDKTRKNFDSKERFNRNDVKIYDLLGLKDIEIIVPMSQNNMQNYSIIFKNENNELIIFDGGRIEDADYLLSIIENYGGVVSGWFLSHIHDDHIGALYKILEDKNFDIEIKNIYYNFASFDWYFNKIGNDAGALYLFENALKNYNDSLNLEGRNINIHRSLNKNDIFYFSDLKVEVLNDMYKLDSDSINNTTIVYKIYFEKYSLLSLGDLGYYGGEKLLKDIDNNKLVSDFVVVSHHGQNGVSKEFYRVVSPKYSIWTTTKRIYDNIDNKYNTKDTIDVLKELNVKYSFKSFEGTFIIK